MSLQSAFSDVWTRVQEPVVLDGLWQVGAAAVLALVVVGLSWARRLSVETELSGAFVRGFVQVVAMGLLIGVLLTVPLAWSTLVLLGMIGGATWISKQRGQGLPNVILISFLSIGVGAGLTIVVMTWAGAIDATVRSLVPVGSMVIANAMRINGLALDRFKQEIRTNRNVIEMGLALGGPPQRVLAPHVRDSVRSALIPVVDALKSLGWVWIPGIMAGMILAGDNPIYAALYQFVIMAMIFAAGGLTSMIGSVLMARAVITDAEQLVTLEGTEA